MRQQFRSLNYDPDTLFVAYITRVERDCLGPLKLCHYLLTKGVTENGTETVFT